MIRNVVLHRSLGKAPVWVITLFAAVCSFGVYFCMYAFRKPFTAAGFEGLAFGGVSYKIWLVTSQVLGYMFSKFYGIRFIGSMKKRKRSDTILLLIFLAWVALFFFAVTPAPFNIVFLFMNGFPLGLVWGVVFSYLEGRQTTEVMGVVLTVSFIFSSGFMKSVGKIMLLDGQLSELWMPFMVGVFFIPPLLLFTWLLNHLPEPGSADIEMRMERKPMNQKERIKLVVTFLPGLVMIMTVYVLLTILRDFRDNFANELWTEFGYGNQASIFTHTEALIALFVLAFMSLLILVKENMKAFVLNHLIIASGFVLMLCASSLYLSAHMNPVFLMTMVGTGLYMSYVPFNCLYFERMIASFRLKGNVGFLMYIADSFGYLGSVLVLFVKQFAGLQLSWTSFFVNIVIVISLVGIVGTTVAALYFRKKYNSDQTIEEPLYAI
jgi:hypothetical protein